MLYKGVATCYLNLLVISSCCIDTNSEMFLMIHLYQIAQLITYGHYILTSTKNASLIITDFLAMIKGNEQ